MMLEIKDVQIEDSDGTATIATAFISQLFIAVLNALVSHRVERWLWWQYLLEIKCYVLGSLIVKIVNKIISQMLIKIHAKRGIHHKQK